MPDGEAGGLGVVDELAVHAGDGLADPGERQAEPVQQGGLAVGDVEADEQERVDPAAHRQRAEELGAPARVGQHVEHEVVAVPPQGRLDAADDLGEEPAARLRQDDADGPHPPGSQGRCQRGGGVPELVGRGEDLVRVSRETLGRPRRARDTVAADTPAGRATSRIPTPRCSPGRPAVLTPFATPSPYPAGSSRAVRTGRPVARPPRRASAYPSRHARLRLRRAAAPRGRTTTRYRLLTTEGVRTVEAGGPHVPRGRARGAAAAHRDGDARHRALPAAGAPGAAAADHRRPARRSPTTGSSRSTC